MEFLISNKRLDKKFIFVKARRCGSDSLNHWLNDNIGKENYVNLSGDNEFINYDILNILESDIINDGLKVTFCRNPLTRVIAGYLADIYHVTPSLGININDKSWPVQSPQTSDLIHNGVGLPMNTYKLTSDKEIHIEAFSKFLDLIIDFQSNGIMTYGWQSEFNLVFQPLYHTVLNDNADNIHFFDKIIKQESLNDDWRFISESLMGTNIPMERINSFDERHSHSNSDTSSFSYLLNYNNNREKIINHWKSDFDLFKYDY